MRTKIELIRSGLCIFIMLVAHELRAQMNGSIRDAQGQPLSGVSVTLKKNGKMITFDISKADGSFTLKFLDTTDTLLLTANKMGFTPIEKYLKYTDTPLKFILEKGDITLKEVVVAAPPIRKRGDTLSFRVEEFQSGADRSIGDVLRKIPGVDVDPSGQITYQGKPINRYYIENMNLLDGRYGLVNENLPHGKVATVQIFENHQPIRALDSLESSERAAINIKLKDKVVKTGNIEYGLGYKPLLWNVNATPIVFLPQFQFLSSAKSNNTGESLFVQFYDFFQAELITKQNWLSVSSLAPPSFSTARWLDNRAHALSVNTLKKSKNELEVKVNMGLILDRQDRSGSFTNTYFLNGETINYSELKNSRFRTNQFSGTLDLIKNAKKSYFKHTLSWEKEWRADLGTDERIDRHYRQENKTQNFNLRHHFERIFSKGRQSVRLHSQSAYSKNVQNLSVSLSAVDTSAHPLQDFSYQGFSTHNYADFSLKLAPAVRVSLRTGVQLGLSRIHTALQGHAIQSDLQSDFKWNTFKPYVSAGTMLYPGKWQINLNFPLSWYTLQYVKTIHRWLPEPNASASLKITPHLQWRTNLRYANTLGQLGDFHPAYIMRTYLTVQQRKSELPSTHRYSAGTGMLFSDAVSGLNFSLNWNYNHLIHNLLPQTLFQSDGSTVMQYISKRNEGQSSVLTGLVSQYLFPLKTTIRAGLTAYSQTSLRSINGKESRFKNRSLSPQMQITFNRFKNFEVNYNTRMHSIMAQAGNLRQFQQEATLTWVSSQHTLVSFTTEQHRIKGTNYLFADLKFRFTPKGSRQDFEISAVNLFNQRDFRTIFLSEFMYQESVFELRPRQFLLRGSFRL